MSSFRVEVQVRDDSKWYSNTIRFKTESEAAAYGADLMGRWLLVERVRVVESSESANYLYREGRLRAI